MHECTWWDAVCHVVPSPSVSWMSKTLLIWDRGIKAMCLSWAGGRVWPSGLRNVVITLCLFLAIWIWRRRRKKHTHMHIKLLIHAAFFIMQERKMFSPVLWWSSGETFRCFSGAEYVMHIGATDMHAEDFLKWIIDHSVFPSPCSHYQARASIGQRGPQPCAGTR